MSGTESPDVGSLALRRNVPGIALHLFGKECKFLGRQPLQRQGGAWMFHFFSEVYGNAMPLARWLKPTWKFYPMSQVRGVSPERQDPCKTEQMDISMPMISKGWMHDRKDALQVETSNLSFPIYTAMRCATSLANIFSLALLRASDLGPMMPPPHAGRGASLNISLAASMIFASSL